MLVALSIFSSNQSVESDPVEINGTEQHEKDTDNQNQDNTNNSDQACTDLLDKGHDFDIIDDDIDLEGTKPDLICTKTSTTLISPKIKLVANDPISEILLLRLRENLLLANVDITKIDADIQVKIRVKRIAEKLEIHCVYNYLNIDSNPIRRVYLCKPGDWINAVNQFTDEFCSSFAGVSDIFAQPFWTKHNINRIDRLALKYLDGRVRYPQINGTEIQFRQISHLCPIPSGVVFTARINNRLYLMKYQNQELTKIPVANADYAACNKDRMVFCCTQDNGSVALLLTDDGGKNLYTIFSSDSIIAPTFNRDGSKLSFVSLKEGRNTVHIYELENNLFVAKKQYHFDEKVKLLTWCPQDDNVIAMLVSAKNGSRVKLLQIEDSSSIQSEVIRSEIIEMQWKGLGLVLSDYDDRYWYTSLICNDTNQLLKCVEIK